MVGLRALLKRIFLSFIFLISTVCFPQKIIDIDFSNEIGIIKDFLGGNKGDGTPSDYLHQIGNRFIRTHDFHGASDYCFYSSFWNTDSAGNFTTINTSFDPDNPLHYDWTQTDSQLSQIVSNGFEIYFRLGVSYPNSMYPMSTFEPPVDDYSDSLSFTKFAQLCKRTAMHYRSGWDDGFFFDIKYFEVWNEPAGLFWDGSVVQYYNMFKSVSDSLKSYDSTILVGGPGAVPTTTIGLNPEYREEFLRFLDSTDTDIDFYSWHIYGAKNPYCLKKYADTIRTLLDISGFTDAEIHISEINSNLDSTLGTLIPSPRGAAYYLSLVLTAQDSPIDVFLWYPTMIFSLGETLYTQSANSIIAFHTMQEETPIIVYSSGDEVVEGGFETDTTNFMVLAAKSEDEDKLYFLISNYKSDNEDYEIYITNLPWTHSDTIEIKRNLIINSLNFAEFTDTILGSDSMRISQTDMAAPSVILFRLRKIPTTNINEHNVKNIEALTISPNPFNSSCEISVPENTNVKIYDIRGNVVKSFYSQQIENLSKSQVKTGASKDKNRTIIWHPDANLPGGIYLLMAKQENQQEITKRIVYIK